MVSKISISESYVRERQRDKEAHQLPEDGDGGAIQATQLSVAPIRSFVPAVAKIIEQNPETNNLDITQVTLQMFTFH